uniref:Fatty-acyl-CoA synthase n=2 Tax=Streptoalloteichus hindustanus TaxID=2017 RepID=UPI002ED709A6
MGYLHRVVEGLKANAGGEALVSADRRLTGAETLEEIHRTARALAAQGLRPGDGVVTLHGNGVEAVVLRIAVQLLGCRYAGLRPVFATREKANFLAEAEAAAFVYQPDMADEAAELLREVPTPRVLSLGPAPLGEDLVALAGAQSAEPVEFTADERAATAVGFTGGTTGRAKGVCRAPFDLEACLDASLTIFGEGPWRFLVCIPIADLGGEMAEWTLAAGGTVVLREDFEPADILATIGAERTTHVFCAPGWVYQLAEHPALADADLSSLTQIPYGGAPSTPARIADALEKLGRPLLVHCYGSQEGGWMTWLSAEDHVRADRYLLNSVGKALPGTEIAIRDQDGADLPVGTVGEVCVRSTMLMRGYWRLPELTAKTVRDGWLHTGDLGRLDTEGYLYLVDRAKDVIIVEAYNVYSQEVEHVLTGHPDVRYAAVVGVPDHDTTEAVYAAVVPAEGVGEIDVDELRALVRTTLGPVHEPKHLDVVDTIPTTPRGHPDKSALRTRWRAAQRA